MEVILKPGVRRELVDFLFHAVVGRGGVGLAGLVVEDVDFRAGVVDDDQVVQPVAVHVGGMKEGDAGSSG